MKLALLFFALLIIFTPIVVSATNITTNLSKEPSYASDRVIIKYRDNTTSQNMAHIENTLKAQIGASTLKNGSTQNFPPSFEVVRLSNEISVADAINYYESNPAVEYA